MAALKREDIELQSGSWRSLAGGACSDSVILSQKKEPGPFFNGEDFLPFVLQTKPMEPQLQKLYSGQKNTLTTQLGFDSGK